MIHLVFTWMLNPKARTFRTQAMASKFLVLCLVTAGAAAGVLPALAQAPRISAGTSAEGVSLSVSGSSTTLYRVETSSDLVHWTPMATTYPSVGTFPANTNFQLIDRELLFGGQNFYRAVRASSPAYWPTNEDIIVSDRMVSLFEGASTTFSVQLSKAPAGALTVQIQPNGSTNVSVISGTALLFGPANWSTPQTVTVSAGLESDFQDSVATLVLSTSNLASTQVKVRAVDNTADDEFVGPFANSTLVTDKNPQ